MQTHSLVPSNLHLGPVRTTAFNKELPLIIYPLSAVLLYLCSFFSKTFQLLSLQFKCSA